MIFRHPFQPLQSFDSVIKCVYTSGYKEQDVLLFGLLEVHDTEIKPYGYYM